MRRLPLTVALIATLLVGCSAGSDTSTSSSPSISASPTSPTITLDSERLAQTVTSLREELMAPGVTALVRTPSGEFTLADGTRTLDGAAPVTLDDHVRIGSNTKTFTTTVILQLVDEAKMALNDPVSKYWDGIPGGDEITITQLLDMRSGLFNYSETVTLNRSLDEQPDRVWRPRELLRLGLKYPVYFPPGDGWHYSNTNTVLLGLIAEKIDGKPLAQIIQDRLLTPLNLDQTSFPPSTTAAMPDPHPQGYMYGTNLSTMKSMALPKAQQKAAREGTLQPNDVTDENPSWTWAAGQMISTTGDLATWVKALGTGAGLLSPGLQTQRLNSVQPADQSLPAGSAEYGLGIAKFGTLYGHTGELPGFNSFMGYDPANDVTVIVWSNLGSAADGRPVATTIARALIGEIYTTG